MKTLKWAVAALFAAVVAVSAPGGDFYLKFGATEWDKASSYCTDAGRTETATTPPGSSDSIHVPAEVFTFDGATEAGRASMAAVSNVFELVTSEGTELRFAVPSGEVGIGCRIRFDTSAAGRIKSTLVKSGGGTLSLLATGSDEYLYAVNLDVQGGCLRLAQGTTYNQNFGWLKVADGATVWLPCSSSSASQAYFHYIKAEAGSVITNATSRATGHVFGVRTATANNTESYIKGVIAGGARIWTVGSLRLEGVNNTISSQVTVEGNMGRLYSDVAGERVGVVLAKKLGMSGEPSSLGTRGDAILGYGSSGAGGFRYIGDGDETCNKTFYVFQPVYGNSAKTISAYPDFFDAGPCGGVTFTGSFAPAQDVNNDYAVRRLWLIGENANECVIAGDIGKLTNGGVTYPTFVTKSGSGTWRFTGRRANHVGGLAVLDGTLKFDSIDEKGFKSSLGDSSVLTADDSRAITNGAYVGYAFTLGGSDGNPVFEYFGAAGAACTTRPLVLAGAGGHLRASNGKLLFRGISARDADSTPTLTLDGTGHGNIARDISDGASGAKVSVVKDGSGSWSLEGDQTFTGGVTVRQGVLSIRTPPNTNKWFRLSIAQLGNSGNLMLIRQVCLYDRDGERQNAGLTMAGSGETTSITAAEIGPGQAWYDSSVAGHKATIYSDHGGLASAFDGYFSGSAGGRYSIYWYNANGSACSPSPTDKSTWIPIVMHLDDSANPITHFDVQGYEDKSQHLPVRIQLETSRDGSVWEVVYSNVDSSSALLGQNNTAWNRWISDGASGTARPYGSGLDVSWPASGTKFSGGLDVQMLGGVLETDSGTAIKSLKADATAGGAIDGFTFAANGTIDVVNWNGEDELPGTFLNCEGLRNIENWTLSFDGVANARRRIAVAGNKLRVVKPGFVLTYR